jgi:hypothetical protein
MDADEFLKQVHPAAKRSRLAPFHDDIIKLRDRGYTLQQICDFLKLNNINISLAGLSKYLKKEDSSLKKNTAPEPQVITPKMNNDILQDTTKNQETRGESIHQELNENDNFDKSDRAARKAAQRERFNKI